MVGKRECDQEQVSAECEDGQEEAPSKVLEESEQETGGRVSGPVAHVARGCHLHELPLHRHHCNFLKHNNRVTVRY